MKCLFFALLFFVPALCVAQNCEFDEDQVVEHKLGKSVIKWTTATSNSLKTLTAFFNCPERFATNR